MLIPFEFFKKQKDKFLVLDIGTETVKALVFQKEKEIVFNLGSAIRYYDEFGVFDGYDLQSEVIKKVIQSVLKEIKSEADYFPKSKLILGGAQGALRARVAQALILRENPKEKIKKTEEQKILNQVFENSKKEIAEVFKKETGILPQELEFIRIKILEKKIDGYEVSKLEGLSGKRMDFRVLATFLPKRNYLSIGKIIKDLNFKHFKISHWLENIFYLPDFAKENCLLLDIGSKITQLAVLRAGKVLNVDEFGIGGRDFSDALSQNLGLNFQDSEELKIRYSERPLAEEIRQRIKFYFKPVAQRWLLELKAKLKNFSKEFILPQKFYLFGGASLLPDFKEVIEQDQEIGSKTIVNLILPKDLRDIKDDTKIKNTPQMIPTLLLTYG